MNSSSSSLHTLLQQVNHGRELIAQQDHNRLPWPEIARCLADLGAEEAMSFNEALRSGKPLPWDSRKVALVWDFARITDQLEDNMRHPLTRAAAQHAESDLYSSHGEALHAVIIGDATPEQAASIVYHLLAVRYGSQKAQRAARDWRERVSAWPRRRLSSKDARQRRPVTTRPKGARREHQAHAAKTSGSQDPGDPDPDPDPTAAAAERLVAEWPSLDAGQRDQLAQLLGTSR
jgi:hypothetical protein